MTTRLAHALLLAGLFLLPHGGPASAATVEACEAEITAVENELESNPRFETEPEGRTDEIRNILAQASEAAEQGDAERCIERVASAKGMAGMR